MSFKGEICLTDYVDDEGLVSAIGEIRGVEASRGVESLLGYFNPREPPTHNNEEQAEAAITDRFYLEQRRLKCW